MVTERLAGQTFSRVRDKGQKWSNLQCRLGAEKFTGGNLGDISRGKKPCSKAAETGVRDPWVPTGKAGRVG